MNINTETKIQKISNIEIKEEPKEFGYYISSNSSEEVKKKARKDNIKIVTISKKYAPIKIEQNKTKATKIDRRKENIKICSELNKNKTEGVKTIDKNIQQAKSTDTNYKVQIIPSLNQEINLEESNNVNINKNISTKKSIEKSEKPQNYEQYPQKSQI